MQGLSGMGLEDDNLRDIMTQVSMASAFGSVVIGELPPMTEQQANDLLADNSLLGVVKPISNQRDLEVRNLSVSSPRILKGLAFDVDSQSHPKKLPLPSCLVS